MTSRRRQRRSYSSGNSLFAILGLMAVVILLYFFVKGIFTILSWVAPVLLLAALLLNYKVVTGYVTWIINSFKTKPLVGLGATIGTFFGFPLVAGYLFIKALLSYKLRNADKPKDGYTEYEEVQEEEDDEDFLDLPEIEKVTTTPSSGKAANGNNEYEDLF